MTNSVASPTPTDNAASGGWNQFNQERVIPIKKYAVRNPSLIVGLVLLFGMLFLVGIGHLIWYTEMFRPLSTPTRLPPHRRAPVWNRYSRPRSTCGRNSRDTPNTPYRFNRRNSSDQPRVCGRLHICLLSRCDRRCYSIGCGCRPRNASFVDTDSCSDQRRTGTVDR